MESGVGLFGTLEVAQRQYDTACEVKDYLKVRPNAAVVNLGFDLNDEKRADKIDAGEGAIFYATGVFYYFKTKDVKALFCRLAERFPGAVLYLMHATGAEQR